MFEALEPYLMEILSLVITGIVTYIGLQAKSIFEKYINTQIKKDVVESTVKYVEQIYKDVHGAEKLEKAKEKALDWLNEKGITISETELEILIESAVNGFNNSLKKDVE